MNLAINPISLIFKVLNNKKAYHDGMSFVNIIIKHDLNW